MASIGSISEENKKKLKLLKLVILEEEGSDPTFNEVLDWMFQAEEVPDEKIKEELDSIVMEEIE